MLFHCESIIKYAVCLLQREDAFIADWGGIDLLSSYCFSICTELTNVKIGCFTAVDYSFTLYRYLYLLAWYYFNLGHYRDPYSNLFLFKLTIYLSFNGKMGLPRGCQLQLFLYYQSMKREICIACVGIFLLLFWFFFFCLSYVVENDGFMLWQNILAGTYQYELTAGIDKNWQVWGKILFGEELKFFTVLHRLWWPYLEWIIRVSLELLLSRLLLLLG